MLFVFLKHFSCQWISASFIIIKYYATPHVLQPGLNPAALWGFVFNFAMVEKAANICSKQLRKTLFRVFPGKANIHFVCTATALT